MDTDLRLGAVEALVALSMSPDYRDRIDAGVALSQFLDLEPAEVALRRLVVDQGDSAVTEETATALVRRHDETSMAIVAGALQSATLSRDDSQGDWIEAGIEAGIGNFFFAEQAWIETMEVRTLPEAEGAGLVAEFMERRRPFNPEDDPVVGKG